MTFPSMTLNTNAHCPVQTGCNTWNMFTKERKYPGNSSQLQLHQILIIHGMSFREMNMTLPPSSSVIPKTNEYSLIAPPICKTQSLTPALCKMN